VPPGLTSPGSLYYYTHCEDALGSDDVTELYAARVLPLKLAVDRVYVRNATLFYDLRVLFRTAAIIVARSFGRRRFPDPPEIAQIHFSSRAALRSHGSEPSPTNIG
jgi:lipopolysaccharide/colanic/teichoic acid biosynthesis glycosyltransferase